MKSKYRDLKLTILLQTVFITALTVLVGGFILVYFVDGVYNDSFADKFVAFMMAFNMDEQTAIKMYWTLIGDNKVFFMILGFLVLFSVFFYFALSKMTQYLDQIEKGIENLASDSAESVELISELKPIEDSLNQIRTTIRRQEKEMRDSEKRKNDLVLFLAHDLKTPLTSVVAYLSMLDTHPDMTEEERAKYTHISLEKAIRLGELINEFFEITKFNMQEIELEPVELDLSIMLEQLADELYAVLCEKNLTCTVASEGNLVIHGDPDKLARVFDNILRNAIAYCKPDSEIRIRAQRKKKDVVIEFANKGGGLTKDELQMIFEKFYRVDNSRSTKTGGAGLGLAIAKEIVTLHHGTITAESDPFETRFIVTLPRKGA